MSEHCPRLDDQVKKRKHKEVGEESLIFSERESEVTGMEKVKEQPRYVLESFESDACIHDPIMKR